jgi:hypothetical protein
MASPQQKPDPSQRPPQPGIAGGDMGNSWVQSEVGKGRPFAWWWIVALVIIAAIVWWMGWGRGRTTTPPANNHSAVTAPAIPSGSASFATGEAQARDGSTVPTHVGTAMRNSTRQI